MSATEDLSLSLMDVVKLSCVQRQTVLDRFLLITKTMLHLDVECPGPIPVDYKDNVTLRG